MEVEVRLFASLRKGRFKKRVMDLPDVACLGDLLQQLSIPKDHAHIRLVNGHHANPDRQLAPNDVVAIFPAIAGG